MPITPKTIFGSSLELWLRADLGITLNGSNVSAWADQSGKGDANRNVTQGTAANQPLFQAFDAGFGGKPTLIQNDNNDFLRSGAWSISVSQPFSVFFVGKCTTGAVLFDGQIGDSTLLYDSSGAGTAWREYAGVGFSSSARADAPSVGVGIFNGGSSSLYVNSRTANTGDSGSLFNMGNAVTLLNDGSHAFGICTCAEVVVVARVVTSAEINSLLSYGGSRYGITIAP